LEADNKQSKTAQSLNLYLSLPSEYSINKSLGNQIQIKIWYW